MCALYIKSEKNFLIANYFWIITYNIIMLFYQKLGPIIVTTVGVVFFLWFIHRYRRKWNIFQMLSFLLCIYIPTSFVSIIGTSYSVLPLTWFNLIIIVLFVMVLFKGFQINYFFFSPLLMIIFGLVSFNKSIDIVDASKQLLTIILFLVSFFIAEFLSQYSSKEYNAKLKSFYLLSVVSFSIVVVIQKLCSLINVMVGYQNVLGMGRTVYAGLMNDFSFATLYIATGAIMLVIEYIGRKGMNIIYFIVIEVFLVIAMLIVNSRTGLVAFGFTSAIYLFFKIVKGNLKSILLAILVLIPIPSILSYITESRGGQSILDGSGRIDLLYSAFQVFTQHPFIGVGFGLNNLYTLTGMYVPHNLIAQYLAQFGLIGSIIFFSNFVVFCHKYLSFQNKYIWTLLSVLVGSMFIPDIVSSRFLTVLIIITIIFSAQKNNQLN